MNFFATPVRLAFHMHFYERGGARQKAMGEALFGMVLAEPCAIRDPRGPLIGSLDF